MLRILILVCLVSLCIAGSLDPFRNVPDLPVVTQPGGGRAFPAFGANGLPGVQIPGGAAQGSGRSGGAPGGAGQAFTGGFKGRPGVQGRAPGGAGQAFPGGLQGRPGGQGEPLQINGPVLNENVGYQYSNTCYIPHQRETCAPHFVIAGAMKSGSTSMFTYLLNHPNILPLKSDAKLNGRPILANKEIRFFNDPLYTQMIKSVGISNALNQYFDVFPDIDKDWKIITGESSPMYICQKEVAQRLKAALPFVKVIVLLRDPIDRAYSEHWFKFALSPHKVFDKERQHVLFEQCARREINILKYCNIDQFLHAEITPQLLALFEQCLFPTLKLLRATKPDDSQCQEGNQYFGMCPPSLSLPDDNGVSYFCNEMGIRISLYALQLVEWVKYFDSDNLLILDSAVFFDDPASVMSEVIDFLGVENDEFDWDFVDGKAYNIISPTKKFAPGAAQTLSIGQDDSSALKEKYPPIDPAFRKELEEFYSPFNALLTNIIKKKFWDY